MNNYKTKMVLVNLTGGNFVWRDNIVQYDNTYLGRDFYKCDLCQVPFETGDMYMIYMETSYRYEGGVLPRLCMRCYKNENSGN
jgi:hypothetical protein